MESRLRMENALSAWYHELMSTANLYNKICFFFEFLIMLVNFRKAYLKQPNRAQPR